MKAVAPKKTSLEVDTQALGASHNFVAATDPLRSWKESPENDPEVEYEKQKASGLPRPSLLSTYLCNQKPESWSRSESRDATIRSQLQPKLPSRSCTTSCSCLGTATDYAAPKRLRRHFLFFSNLSAPLNWGYPRRGGYDNDLLGCFLWICDCSRVVDSFIIWKLTTGGSWCDGSSEALPVASLCTCSSWLYKRETNYSMCMEWFSGGFLWVLNWCVSFKVDEVVGDSWRRQAQDGTPECYDSTSLKCFELFLPVTFFGCLSKPRQLCGVLANNERVAWISFSPLFTADAIR